MTDKTAIEKEAEKLYPLLEFSEGHVLEKVFTTNDLIAAKQLGWIAAASKYSEESKQSHADTWDAAYNWTQRMGNSIMVVIDKEKAKEEYLNNKFPTT